MDPVGRALEQAKRDSEEAAALGRLRIKLREPLSHLGGPQPSRRASEPAGRAMDPVGRDSNKARISEGAIKGGPVGDNDLWYHYREIFIFIRTCKEEAAALGGPRIKLGEPWSQLGGPQSQLGWP